MLLALRERRVRNDDRIHLHRVEVAPLPLARVVPAARLEAARALQFFRIVERNFPTSGRTEEPNDIIGLPREDATTKTY